MPTNEKQFTAGGGKIQLVTERVAAEMLACSVQTLRNDRSLGRGLPYVKINRRVRYRLDDLSGAVEQNTIRPREA